MSSQPVISVRNLGRDFGRTRALSGVNLELTTGAVVGVLGPNGCGKTTLMKHLIGLLLPSHGHVEVFGTEARRLSAAQMARIGYVSQDNELLAWLTVTETLDFAKAHQPAWDEQLAERLVREFALQGHQKVGELSGGLKQRLSIVLGVAHRPQLLLLDEPASALDPIVRQDFLDLLMELVQDGSRTILISSHILTDIEKVIDQVLIMNQGTVHCCQPLDDLREEYYRVELDALGPDLAAGLGLSGVKHVARTGSAATLTVHNPRRGDLEAEVERLGCKAAIRNLEFEEIYRLVVTGK